METVRVSSKGQIVIPKSLRAAFHIEAGSELAIFAKGDEIHLRQAEQRFARGAKSSARCGMCWACRACGWRTNRHYIAPCNGSSAGSTLPTPCIWARLLPRRR